MLEDLSDPELLARHADGDRAAFGVLVARHRDRAWAVALRTLGDPTDAADAVQEAFVKAYRTAGSFRGDALFTTWLHRIVVNSCLDLMRRSRARPASSLDETAAAIADSADPVSRIDLGHDVVAALQRLSAEQRVAIVLVDLEGYTVEEAAAVLDVPTGTVKSRCHRGRVQLATLLGHLRPGRGTEPAPVASDPGSEPPEQRRP
ncbi:MAG TPA: RNA polymerase sigma factor SigM [Mycobacteriales bacterium]|jgi:RNA polymerase sigma-70 factor (ECF subfamily)|nr:RNA polymerase sigma factor SigM [Mycobacteriales bacterium]